ncbi:MAG: type II toxin-antitoxin system HicB family antitoxin [Lachnospiraceae bacterium]|nr:type II toxin-antitoxin system HicB family antitoxin [Lachnospiraceae bacterium]
MVVAYPVLFTRTNDEKDTYLVYIPDIDGATEGYGLSDAIKMARDYIGGALYHKNEEEYPCSGDIKKIKPSSSIFQNEGETFTSIVDVDMEAYERMIDNKTVRRNVSLPNWLNQEVEKKHINVSRVLQEALKEKLGIA